jgi:glyoxylase I family protein
LIEYVALHHVSLAVRNLERSRDFYTNLLKFTEIPRPPFNSNGIWYAVGPVQQLHLLEHPTGETLRVGKIDSVDGHFAVWVKSYKDTIAFLEAAAIAHEARPDSLAGFSQIYVLDLDSNIIEFGAAYGS